MTLMIPKSIGFLQMCVAAALALIAGSGAQADDDAVTMRRVYQDGNIRTMVTQTRTDVTAQLSNQAPAQNPPGEPEPNKKPKRHLYIGPDIGVFLPTSSKTRSRFGDAWLDYGYSLGAIGGLRSGGRFSPDLHILSQSHNNNDLFFGLIGIEYRRPFFARRDAHGPHDDKHSRPGQPQDEKGAPPRDGGNGNPNGPNPQPGSRKPSILPYFGFSADLMVGDLRDLEDNIHSGVRTGASGSAFLGLQFSDRAFLEARYQQATVIKSFDLSGFNVDVGYRFAF